MVILNKIYTKTGDDGTTALGSGERRPKYDLRVSAYGTVDEANACIGIARLHTSKSDHQLDVVLGRIQNDMFDLGADLATPEVESKSGIEALRITEVQVSAIEAEIDKYNANLEPLRSFILPGGSTAAAHLHLARTVVRRAERMMVELDCTKEETVNPAAIKYINRLSDFLFVAGRVVNNNGKDDILWVPGKNR